MPEADLTNDKARLALMELHKRILDGILSDCAYTVERRDGRVIYIFNFEERTDE